MRCSASAAGSFVFRSTNPGGLRPPCRLHARILRSVKSSRELSDAQLRKLLAVAMRHRGYYLRLWDRCRAHGLGLDDDLARYACEAWNALARYTGTLEDLRRKLPQPYRPLKEPRRTSGLASRREVWADRQEEAQREVERHGRDAPPDPTA